MTKPTKIELPPLKLAHAEMGIIGDTPLITHAWSQKARQEMLCKQMKLPVHRETKDPIDAFMRSMYRTDENYYGAPAVGFKNAMVSACTSVDGVTKTAARQAFIVVGERGKTRAAFADLFSPQDLVRILSPNPPTLREDMVRLAGIGNTADLRYRAEFWPWGAKLTIRFNQNVLSLDQLANLLNTSGFGVGLCEWRPERDGQYGTFHVADEAEMKMLSSRSWQNHREPELPDVAGWLRTINLAAELGQGNVRAVARRGRSSRRPVKVPEAFDIPSEAANDALFDLAAANDPVFDPADEPTPPAPRRRRRNSGASDEA
jgi:hypothetical protein